MLVWIHLINVFNIKFLKAKTIYCNFKMKRTNGSLQISVSARLVSESVWVRERWEWVGEEKWCGVWVICGEWGICGARCGVRWVRNGWFW